MSPAILTSSVLLTEVSSCSRSMADNSRKKDKTSWPTWQHMVDVAQELGKYLKQNKKKTELKMVWYIQYSNPKFHPNMNWFTPNIFLWNLNALLSHKECSEWSVAQMLSKKQQKIWKQVSGSIQLIFDLMFHFLFHLLEVPKKCMEFHKFFQSIATWKILFHTKQEKFK